MYRIAGKFWRRIKFGGLAKGGLACDRQIKFRQYFILNFYKLWRFGFRPHPPNLIPANISGPLHPQNKESLTSYQFYCIDVQSLFPLDGVIFEPPWCLGLVSWSPLPSTSVSEWSLPSAPATCSTSAFLSFSFFTRLCGSVSTSYSSELLRWDFMQLMNPSVHGFKFLPQKMPP